MNRTTTSRPLPALLSQVLVAFTVEYDNEFERRMAKAGYPGALLSLTLWTDLIRFIGEGVTVRDLAAAAAVPGTRLKFQLGCLERWGFIALQDAPQKRREGWGSGRGIRTDWVVRLTSSGKAAAKIWPPLFAEIERRWEHRFGREEIDRLRHALQDIANKLDPELPHGLQALPSLLSRLLMTFQREFNLESPAPLELCANTLRVLGEDPIPMAEIPRLTGCSPETSGIGWRIKPYVIVEADPNAKRSKVVSLSPRGLRAKKTYEVLIAKIESRWEARVGRQEIERLRASLQGLFEQHTEDGLRLARGLVPHPGTIRAGHTPPALGRKDVGPAARQRARDLVAQTQAFIQDPAGALPHYPLWDMNRGFGP